MFLIQVGGMKGIEQYVPGTVITYGKMPGMKVGMTKENVDKKRMEQKVHQRKSEMHRKRRRANRIILITRRQKIPRKRCYKEGSRHETRQKRSQRSHYFQYVEIGKEVQERSQCVIKNTGGCS